MKKIVLFSLLSCFALLHSCDPNKEGIKCYPTRVTTTISTGAGATSIIADYHYSGDTLSYIIYSTGETHYYSYDSFGMLQAVKAVNDKLLRKDEYILNWDGNELLRVDISMMNIDYNDRLDIDTFYYAYREFEYKGKVIEKESSYERESLDVSFQLSETKVFSYDDNGNLSSILVNDADGVLLSTSTMTYDLNKHPYSALKLLFDGAESHVNNLLSKTVEEEGTDFIYTVIYNNYLYPDQVIEKENGVISKNIRYVYECR